MSYRPRARSSRGGYRSPRGGSIRGIFGSRGRGSKSTFNFRDDFSNKPYGSSFKYSSSNYRNNYNNSGGYNNNKFGESHTSRKDMNYRESREIGMGYRDHSRKSDFEPYRKRAKHESDIGDFRIGSSRRTYDELNHSRSSGHSGSSSGSSYSPFLHKSHKVGSDNDEFRRPYPINKDYNRSRWSSRGGTNGKPAVSSRPSLIVRSRPSSTISLRNTRTARSAASAKILERLEKKKQMADRMRKKYKTESSTSVHEEKTGPTSDEELIVKEEIVDTTIEQEIPIGSSSPKKQTESKVKTDKVVEKNTETESNTKVSAKTDSVKSPAKNYQTPYVELVCAHCVRKYPTFHVYRRHLGTFEHKKSLERSIYRLKIKLRDIRMKQRSQQRVLDEQCEENANSNYCTLCKLNYKQTTPEHVTSTLHVKINDLLNPRCKTCDLSFATAVLYEEHRVTVGHLRRKSLLKRDKKNEENNDDFMVLDSVGSADENENDAENLGLKKHPTMIGFEHLKKITSYYCNLCKVSIQYEPDKNEDELLLQHCRCPYHLEQYNQHKKETPKRKKAAKQVDSAPANVNDNEGTLEPVDDEEIVELTTVDDAECDDDLELSTKLSEDEDDTISEREDRYNRFENSDKKETEASEVEAEVEDSIDEAAENA